MKFADPLAFNVAGTQIVRPEMDLALKAMGAEGWTTNAASEGQELIEFAGKGCYKSFNLDINPNLTRIRENRNAEYIQDGLIGVEHGSVLEHVHESFALVGVTRVLTHEIVRHRIANYSQESLRFVRLTDLVAYFPQVFGEEFLSHISDHLVSKGQEPLDVTEDDMRARMKGVFEFLETQQLEMAQELRLDDLEQFGAKKKLTSAMRRMAPIGLATSILMTTNLRQWREIIAKRSSRHAEEEIRFVTEIIFDKLKAKHPDVFADAEEEMVDGFKEIRFAHAC